MWQNNFGSADAYSFLLVTVQNSIAACWMTSPLFLIFQTSVTVLLVSLYSVFRKTVCFLSSLKNGNLMQKVSGYWIKNACAIPKGKRTKQGKDCLKKKSSHLNLWTSQKFKYQEQFTTFAKISMFLKKHLALKNYLPFLCRILYRSKVYTKYFCHQMFSKLQEIFISGINL